MAEKYKAVIAVPPGETLAEILEDRQMTQKELADRTGLSIKHINEIVQGKASITSDTALKLEAVLGIPASFWMNLEANYQETKARLAAEEAISEEVSLVKEFPYSEMAKMGLVPSTRDGREKVLALRGYFAVASLERLQTTLPAAFRTAAVREASPFALAAWLRRGEIIAQQKSVSSFQRDKLKSSIPILRGLTTKETQQFCLEMERICSDCGIALVYVPHLPKTYTHGAAYWLSPQRAVVQLSVRCKYADIFWFSFFHELGHLVLGHSKKETFVSYDGMRGTTTPKEEQAADAFAANTLVPAADYRAFLKRGDLTSGAIVNFAEQIDIHPGIVVGRLQHDRHLQFNQSNNLREQYQITK